MAHDTETLDHLFAQYGIETRAAENVKRKETERKDLPTSLADGSGVNEHDILEAVYGQRYEPTDLEEQDEIGSVGTYMVDGYIRMETTTKYRPIQVRGFWGHPGDFEDYYRQEVVVRDSIDGIVEVQRAASREVQAPDPELVPDGLQDEMDEWVDRLNGWWANIEPSAENYVQNATHSVCQFGLAPFEVAWDVPDDGVPMPWKFAYREPSTIDRWVTNDRNDTLLGATFQTGGDSAHRYFLPATGDRLHDTRLIVPRISARGNNWEGISPIRPAIHWIKFKQLLGQIAAAAAQKYGVPMTFVKVDPALFEYAAGVDQQTLDETIDKLDRTQAVEAPMFGLPDGLTAETVAPPGQMPMLKELMTYCDEMIARPFSNEGSLLGHNQIGSYALAQVQEDKWLRSAPAYDRVIMQPIDQLIRKMTVLRFGTQMRAYPTMGMRLDATTDTSARIADLSTVNGNLPINQWPEAMQKTALEALNMAPDALEGEEPQPQADDPTDNGFDAGTIPQATVSALSRGQEREGDPRELAEHSERMAMCLAEFESAADGLQKFMDSSESALARKWNSIAAEQRREFRDMSEGLNTAQALRDLKRDMQDEFEERYIAAAREQADTLQKKGAQQLLKEYGISFPRDGSVPQLPPTLREQMEANLISAASEVNNRNTSFMFDQRMEQLTGSTRTSVDKLNKTTLSSIAGKVTGRAFNAGRTATVTAAAQRYEQRTGKEVRGKFDPQDTRDVGTGERKITVVRSTMLDSNVCGPCRDLEGEEQTYGTAFYYRNHPPEPCEGGRRCRCVNIHEVPADMEEDLRAAVDDVPTPF